MGSMYFIYFPTFTIKNQPNVGKYTSPMDPMGMISWLVGEAGRENMARTTAGSSHLAHGEITFSKHG